MLCSMAYFLALLRFSCWEEVSLAGSIGLGSFFAPGPAISGPAWSPCDAMGEGLIGAWGISSTPAENRIQSQHLWWLLS